MEQSENKINNENSNINNNITPMENMEVDVSKVKIDIKKEKCKPMTKVVIRRLPPSMTQNQFIEQVSPLPDHDYLYYVKADTSLGQNSFSRAYINFSEQQDIFMFREKFDNYVFVDSKGSEYPAVVEFAPFQRLPKKRIGRKKDPKCGTIESDHYYIQFLESLKNQETDSAAAQPKTEYSYQPFDNVQKRVTTTPLLEYLKQRKAEKQRLKDEKREERRRRDLERRRIKDEPTISKVLKNPDAEREGNRENKENKDEKDKISSKEIKIRKRDDMKSRDKMVISRDRDSKGMTKNYRDREDKKYERDSKNSSKKHEEKKSYTKRDEKDNYLRDDKKNDGRSYFKDNRKDCREDTSQQKERMMDEKKGKSYEKMRQEKRRMVELKKEGIEENVDLQQIEIENKKSDIKNDTISISLIQTKSTTSSIQHDDVQSNDDLNQIYYNSCNKTPNNSKTEANIVTRQIDQILSNELKINKELNNSTKVKMQSTKIAKRRSSLESGGEGGVNDNTYLRRHKSLDGENEDNLQKNESDEKDKNKKDPRLERRIRNKDRPAMEIYRPGMGKFSKQRLEREKSNHDDRASLSQSPTPLGKAGSAKNNDSNPLVLSTSAELRSMTFKRSVSRDIP